MQNLRILVPGSITGFFEICKHENALKKGSRGASIVINRGVKTQLNIKEGEKKSRIEIYFNNKLCNCKTSKLAARIALLATCGCYDLKIEHFSELPSSQGFGTSASGALGIVLCINKALNIGLGIEQIGKIAHLAEVISSSGLGSVISQINGGLVIRTKEGAPGIGKVRKIEIQDKLFIVSFIAGGKIPTKRILGDKRAVERINSTAEFCIKEMLKEPSIDKFLKLSNYFTKRVMFMSRNSARIIKNLEKHGIIAAQQMLGNAIFTITDNPERIIKLADKENLKSEIIISEIRSESLKLL